MLMKNLPFALAVLLIVSLTLVEARFSDRWYDSTIDAAEFGKRFKNVPMEIGLWDGKDQEVEEDIRRTAGAVEYVSRIYTNRITGRWVKLWLIVGHSRDVVRHTPNICYPRAGFVQQSKMFKHHTKTANDKPAVFYTAKFEKSDALSRHTERVFWSWNLPSKGVWEAPDYARGEYGNARVLYKLYFTSTVMKGEETIEENIAAEFGKLMLPYVDAALFPPALFPDKEDSAQTSETEQVAPAPAEPQKQETGPQKQETGPQKQGTGPQEESSEEKSIFDAVS